MIKIIFRFTDWANLKLLLAKCMIIASFANGSHILKIVSKCKCSKRSYFASISFDQGNLINIFLSLKISEKSLFYFRICARFCLLKCLFWQKFVVEKKWVECPNSQSLQVNVIIQITPIAHLNFSRRKNRNSH